MLSADRYRTQSYWEKRWVTGDTFWHKSGGDETLHKYLNLLTGGRHPIKFLFPLCGKAVDMKWLADRGHKVVGIEYTVTAIVEFFKEQGLEYTIQRDGQMPVYKSKNNNIHIYQGDIFNFNVNSEGRFDAIWDTGSIVAINKEDRRRYADLMLSLMSQERGGCKCLMRIWEYDEQFYGGPPCYVPESALRELYGGACDIKTLEMTDSLEFGHKLFSDKFQYFTDRIYLIQTRNCEPVNPGA